MSQKVPFRRVTRDGHAFSLLHQRVKVSGELTAFRPKLLLLRARMEGPLEVDCYRCGATFDIMVGENVSFLLSEGVFKGQDDEYDVVEIHQDLIDLDAVFDSEIALIQSDYHACEQCREEI